MALQTSYKRIHVGVVIPMINPHHYSGAPRMAIINGQTHKVVYTTRKGLFYLPVTEEFVTHLAIQGEVHEEVGCSRWEAGAEYANDEVWAASCDGSWVRVEPDEEGVFQGPVLRIYGANEEDLAYQIQSIRDRFRPEGPHHTNYQQHGIKYDLQLHSFVLDVSFFGMVGPGAESHLPGITQPDPKKNGSHIVACLFERLAKIHNEYQNLFGAYQSNPVVAHVRGQHLHPLNMGLEEAQKAHRAWKLEYLRGLFDWHGYSPPEDAFKQAEEEVVEAAQDRATADTRTLEDQRALDTISQT